MRQYRRRDFPNEYRAWANAKARCYNINDRNYKYYGERGIKMHPDWLDSFSAFMQHIGRKPSPELTLDRIDNNKGYEPGNVRWIDRKTQQSNRNNHKKT